MPTETPAKPLTETELAAWRGLLRVHATLARELDAELEAAHQLPLTSYDVLTTLADAPEGRMRMCGLADAIVLSRSGLSRLVDRLEGEGLVERQHCSSDARGAFAALTDEGRERLRSAQCAHREGVRRRFLSHFSEDELKQLARTWERVLATPRT
jgi:DNA-binding MarR family transcriptional regulator